jgi:fumarate reductase (CoM/CoB) subunit A
METIPEERLVEIRKQIKAINWDKVGIVRDGESLGEAIEALSSLKRELAGGQPDSKERLGHYLELRSMLITSLAIAQAALFREETRGAHFREDFPESDQAMKKPVHVALEKGEIKAGFAGE